MLKVACPSSKAADLVGNFVNLVKRGGRVYAGHIHQHKEMRVKGRWFSFVGSPYQQNLGEMGSACGYYVLDEQNVPEFVETKSAPRHVQVLMSEAVSGSYDFSAVSGCIVQKVYDADVDPAADVDVSRKIAAFKPYEELLPDYRVRVERDGRTDNESLELIRKSKLEYIRNYVDKIDQTALDEQGLDREKLFGLLERYYKGVVSISGRSPKSSWCAARTKTFPTTKPTARARPILSPRCCTRCSGNCTEK